jgi:alpha-beta hydrolase superfamily lysophospholipase
VKGWALLVVAASACAHTPNLDLRPEPAPPGEEVAAFDAHDGTKLWRRHWLPTAPEKGILIIQHGLRDHSDNYDHLARRAAAAGFSVWAMDLRGHARSAGPRVAPDPWMDYVVDFDQLVGIAVAAEPNQPVFIMGHSMGGAIVAMEVVEHRAKFAGVILSAPVLNLGVPPLVVASVRMFGVLAPSLGVMKLDPNSFSTDPAVGQAMVKDPLVEQGAGPARTASGLADATAQIFEHIDQFTLPILALHGTADQLTAPSGSRALIERAPSPDKTLRIYPGFAHDLVHEPKGVQVEDDILAWLGAHTAPCHNSGEPGGCAGVAAPAVTPPPVYAGPLRGDPAGSLVALSLGGGVLGAKSNFGGSATGEFELGLHLGFAAPVGWAAAASIRASGNGFEGALMPIGLAARFGAGTVGIATGAATLPSGFNFAIPAAAWLELPVGPLHATLDGQLAYRIGGSPARAAIAKSDLGEVGLALRLPGDREYWPKMFAGVGPYVRGALLDAGGATAISLTAGLALYGAD